MRRSQKEAGGEPEVRGTEGKGQKRKSHLHTHGGRADSRLLREKEKEDFVKSRDSPGPTRERLIWSEMGPEHLSVF